MATKKSAPKKLVTTVVGEEKAPITTLALGEEHVVTTLVGEQATPHPDYGKVVEPDEADATTVVGEQWHVGPVTTVVGEETTIVGESHGPITTLAEGEEAGGGGTVFGPGGGFGSF